jgi:DHA2 family multidrug resistance protein
MGNATSMFNLMRNLGGSIGIAAATTFLFRRQQFHTHLLVANVNQYNAATRQMAASLTGSFASRGSDPVDAARRAYGAIWGMVLQQSAMVSFVDTFLALSVVFMVMLPLLLLMKKPAKGLGGGPVH